MIRFNMWPLLCITTMPCFGSSVIDKMSLEEKVGQVLMVHFHGDRVNDDAKALVQNTKVGSIIYYNWSNGLTSAPQVRALSSGLQELTKTNRLSIPLLIAADQEGGVVARLDQGFTSFPGNRALGQTKDPKLAELSAQAIGEEMQAVGINMNLAPVVDVNSNPYNPVIGVRSFADDPETVTAFAKKALEGFKKAQVVATLKHFPGHGDVGVDSHADLPIIHKSKTELAQVELLPFTQLASSADAIMTAHILVPALDPDHCSTLSEKTLSYLRNEIGFQGVIVADSLVMAGVLKQCSSVDEASIAALNAGCDLLILGGKLLVGEHVGLELTTADIERVHRAIVNAVETGRIKQERLDSAVIRILKLKERYLNADAVSPKLADLPEKVATQEHRALAEKIASLALKIQHKQGKKITGLTDQKILIVAPRLLQKNLEQTSLLQIGKSVDTYFFNTLAPSKEEAEAVQKQAEKADVVLICSYNAWKNPSAIDVTQSLIKLAKSSIVLSVRDPLDASLFSDADLLFTSFSPSTPSLQAICNELNQHCK